MIPKEDALFKARPSPKLCWIKTTNINDKPNKCILLRFQNQNKTIKQQEFLLFCCFDFDPKISTKCI